MKHTLAIVLSTLLSATVYGQSKEAVDFEKSQQEWAQRVGLDCAPRYDGGLDSIMSYLATHTHYPDIAIERGIEGRVMVSFVVGKDGQCCDATVVHEVHPILAEEAVRVILSMPKWHPATKNGIPVRVRYSLPVNFVIPEELKALYKQ